MKKYIYSFLFLVVVVNVFAQYSSGLKFYNQFQYNQAIEKFKKVKSTDKNYADALLKTADSYRMLRDFKNAAPAYKAAIDAGVSDKNIRYYYGSALKSTNQYDEALNQFLLYVKDNPTDKKAQNAIKSCNEIKAAMSLPIEYKATNLTSINTKNAEFCPVWFEKGLVYVSNQKADWVNIDKFADDGIPSTQLYYTEQKDDSTFSPKKNFSKKINADFHDGPISISADNTMLFFTRVEYKEHTGNKNFVNQPKIYYTIKKGNAWQKPIEFPYNSNEYATEHPSISADGNYLFFASNMPGGKGGMDIWVSKKDSSSWGKPINLGGDINTWSNEMFPFIRKDGMLFFSSDELPGFGGLDIFSAKQIDDKWILNKNEGKGLNSLADDFGVYFIDNKKGFVSSNRDGGAGLDDIYMFTYSPANVLIDGTVYRKKNTKQPVPNVKVWLQDEQHNPLKNTITNDKGYFRFENLLSDRKYEVRIDEADAVVNKGKPFYYATPDSALVRTTPLKENDSKFIFHDLPANANTISDIHINDMSIGGTLLYGQNPSKAIPNAKVTLIDEDGNEVAKTTTNFFGSFAFMNVSSYENYSLKTDMPKGMKMPSNTRMVLTNGSGKEVKVITADKTGKYNFNKLNSNGSSLSDIQAQDTDLVMDISGKILDQKKKKLPNATVAVIDNKGDTLEREITDANGSFSFKHLHAVQDYTLAINDKTEATKNIDTLYVADSEEHIVQALIKDFTNGFQYRMLSSETSVLKQIYVDDPWLDILQMSSTKDAVINESVYYEVGGYKLSDAGKNMMNKVILVMKNNPKISIEIGSHTDSRGNDDMNLDLSKKRAKAAADYIIANGINATRVKDIGYGETKLINKCNNNTSCTEEEHAQNRRTEFKVINKK